MKSLPTTLLALGLLFSFGCSQSESTEAAGTTPPVTAKAPAVKNAGAVAAPDYSKATLTEVLDVRKSLLTDTTQALKDVTSVDGARAAVPALDAIAARVEPLKARQEELKHGSLDDQTEYAKTMVGMLGNANELGIQLQRVMQIPGVDAILSGSLDKILGFLGISKP